MTHIEIYNALMPQRSPDLLAKALAGPHPLTLPQLQQALLGASRTTTFRYLRQVDYLRSYNCNGRFYTLLDPQRFDRFGLLSIGTARFSRDRTLTRTVPRLIQESEAGWTDRELRSLLHVPVRPFLLSSLRARLVQRERLHGVFVYFAADGALAWRQREHRLHHMPRSLDLDPSLVIEVLLAVIRSPAASPVQLARRLQGHSPPIELSHILAVFDRFDLPQAVEKGGPAHS